MPSAWRYFRIILFQVDIGFFRLIIRATVHTVCVKVADDSSVTPCSHAGHIKRPALSFSLGVKPFHAHGLRRPGICRKMAGDASFSEQIADGMRIRPPIW